MKSPIQTHHPQLPKPAKPHPKDHLLDGRGIKILSFDVRCDGLNDLKQRSESFIFPPPEWLGVYEGGQYPVGWCRDELSPPPWNTNPIAIRRMVPFAKGSWNPTKLFAPLTYQATGVVVKVFSQRIHYLRRFGGEGRLKGHETSYEFLTKNNRLSSSSLVFRLHLGG